jgi:hypothetical protein
MHGVVNIEKLGRAFIMARKAEYHEIARLIWESYTEEPYPTDEEFAQSLEFRRALERPE